MNIAAAIAARNIRDLKPSARHLVMLVASYANRDGWAKVSIERLAEDMGSHHATAWRAVREAEAAGYLTVEKRGPKRRLFRVNFRASAKGSFAPVQTDFRASAKDRAARPYLLFKDLKEREPARANRVAPSHPETCICGGSGWFEQTRGAVIRCPQMEFTND